MEFNLPNIKIPKKINSNFQFKKKISLLVKRTKKITITKWNNDPFLKKISTFLVISLVVIWFTYSFIISCIDCKVWCINMISFYCCFEKLWMMYCTVLFEIELLILILLYFLTFVLTPHNLNYSTSTFKSYLSWPYSVRKSA